MSQAEKSALYQAIKSTGAQLPKHYREYSVSELRRLTTQMGITPAEPRPQQPSVQEQLVRPPGQPASFAPPVRSKDPNELAGQRQNTNRAANEPIRTDPDGKIWYQEEVLKPAYPKPRGRRILKYLEAGTVERKVQNGDYTETFEVSGDMSQAVQAEVKITLPSYQVGIYKDPRFPFKVVCYNGNEGFELDEVQDYYGGAEMVPPAVKRKYVENVLCYDIRTVVRAINEEFRQQKLSGKIR
jgi:hypothetical protein